VAILSLAEVSAGIADFDGLLVADGWDIVTSTISAIAVQAD